MSGHRWIKFWPQDWRSDPALRSCSVAARGLWFELLCIATEGQPYGHVTIAGRCPSVAQIARNVAIEIAEAETLLAELELAGVFSRTADGVIYSRRLVRDFEASATGRKHVQRRWDNHRKRLAKTSPNSHNGELPITLEARSKKQDTSNPKGLADGSAAADPSESPRDLVWTEGVKKIEQLTGRTNGTVRSFIGKMLKIGGDDCAIVLSAIRDCPQTGDPGAWIAASIRARGSPAASHTDQLERDVMAELDREAAA